MLESSRLNKLLSTRLWCEINDWQFVNGREIQTKHTHLFTHSFSHSLARTQIETLGRECCTYNTYFGRRPLHDSIIPWTILSWNGNWLALLFLFLSRYNYNCFVYVRIENGRLRLKSRGKIGFDTHLRL